MSCVVREIKSSKAGKVLCVVVMTMIFLEFGQYFCIIFDGRNCVEGQIALDILCNGCILINLSGCGLKVILCDLIIGIAVNKSDKRQSYSKHACLEYRELLCIHADDKEQEPEAQHA